MVSHAPSSNQQVRCGNLFVKFLHMRVVYLISREVSCSFGTYMQVRIMFTVSIVTASHVEMSFDFGPSLRHASGSAYSGSALTILLDIKIETICFTKEEISVHLLMLVSGTQGQKAKHGRKLLILWALCFS